MLEKKSNSKINKYCLWFVALFIVSGCSTQSKREKLISIQKIRINKLEQQLARKNQELEKIKVNKWVSEPAPVPEAKALGELKQKIKNKQWVAALKQSGDLKKTYPDSVKLAKYRILIFKKMGLKKQAIEEYNLIKKMRAKKLKSTKKI